ncbi:unnamed protein product [Cuscuta campestris]|uniref:Carboxypeptidase n=1 Tax=Cuscuta campestris TaxID=132261 RepID=A0A484L6Y5_9ASTE|nr:unnamed protein product [Cuscuta campestris]
MIGNGLMSDATLDRGTIDYMWSHALISDETHTGLQEHCLPKNHDKRACDHFQSAANREQQGDNMIDPYNIYGPVCFDYSHNRSSVQFNKRRFGYDPCEQDYVHKYLNLHHVQQALHANTTNLPYPWDLCSEEIKEWKDSPSTMFPIYKRLMASALHILLYSGDADSVVPVTSTRYALDAMNLTILKPWHPWQHPTHKEVAGYKVEYKGITFATVKGGGHLVPQTNPLSAFTLLNMFITREWENLGTTREEDADDDEEDLELSPEADDGAAADLISGGLPGQPSGGGGKPFEQYAGYVNVDERNGRSLFYYFVESAAAAEDPHTKPLILWLSGGPGLSSLGAGAFLEIGPFGVNPDGKTLYPRKFSWNKVANILFVESPAGVGFSYSNTSSDYDKSGDKLTAQDSYTFLQNWFKRYPQYQTTDFYIAGKDYSGFYIPELADVIIKKNKIAADNSLKINLKGIMIGNGIMNIPTDTRGFIDYAWSHALISDEAHQALLKHCITNDSSCERSLNEAATEIGNIDTYNIYGPLCSDSSRNRSSVMFNKRRFGYDPCENEYVHSYFNLPEVQKALHANTTKLPYLWYIGSNEVYTKWTDRPTTMFLIYKRLIASRLQILLYSGDVDAIIPVTSTRYSLDAMNLKVVTPWHLWKDASENVAGYKVVYDGLTFATVKGAGEVVLQSKPRSAFVLLNMFLAEAAANNHR